MNKVTVDFNPYIPELKVYVNDRTVSKYSSIMTYKNMPFIKWCELFFDEIYKEVNDSYKLIFVGTEFEAEIFEKLSHEQSRCISFIYREPELNATIFERLIELEKLQDINGQDEIMVNLLSDDESLIDAALDILDESGTFLYQTEESVICDDCPLVDFIIQKSFGQNKAENAINIVLAGNYPDDEMINQYDDNEPAFIFNITSESSFSEKIGNVYIYFIDADRLSEYLMKVIVGYRLCAFLSDEAYKLQNNDFHLTEPEKDELVKICLTHPIYKTDLPKEMYKGRSFKLDIKEYPALSENDYRIISDNRAVIDIRELNLIAKNSGIANISVYKEGSPDVLLSGEVKVTEAVLIENIQVFPKHIGVKEGFMETVQITFQPGNAVNQHEIRFSSGDENIAIIEDKSVKGISCGVCSLNISAGEVNTVATIEVMPALEDIICLSSIIDVVVGGKVEWRYKLQPENCYERDLIKVKSSNENVAIYRGGYIIGKNPGTANISIHAPDNSIKKNCRVTVSKKKLFG